MIDSRELRRGNWVGHTTMPNMKVSRIAEASVDLDMPGSEADYWDANVLDLVAIPLTTYILEKCPDVVWKYGTTFFIGKLKFTYEKNELSEFVRFHYSGKVKYLQYLHELQNLYYCLTGQELTITL